MKKCHQSTAACEMTIVGSAEEQSKPLILKSANNIYLAATIVEKSLPLSAWNDSYSNKRMWGFSLSLFLWLCLWLSANRILRHSLNEVGSFDRSNNCIKAAGDRSAESAMALPYWRVEDLFIHVYWLKNFDIIVKHISLIINNLIF